MKSQLLKICVILFAYQISLAYFRLVKIIRTNLPLCLLHVICGWGIPVALQSNFTEFCLITFVSVGSTTQLGGTEISFCINFSGTCTINTKVDNAF